MRRAALSATSVGARLTGYTRRGLRRHRVHLLYLHSVAPGEEDCFRSLLARLSKHHVFLTHSEAVDRVATGAIDASYVSVSFDDGLASCRRAAEILSEFGASGAFFVCPKLVDCESLAEVRSFFRIGPDKPAEASMGWRDLEWLKDNGHEIGSHTMSHLNLAQLGRDQLAEEIGTSFELLNERLGDVKHFAWPYGRFVDFSAAAARVVFESGFVSCSSAVRGCHTRSATTPREQLCLRRENVEPDHPLAEHLYFMGRSSIRSKEDDNLWPVEWRS